VQERGGGKEPGQLGLYRDSDPWPIEKKEKAFYFSKPFKICKPLEFKPDLNFK
jgi:hypothetical protein